jgi:hypothetical protein
MELIAKRANTPEFICMVKLFLAGVCAPGDERQNSEANGELPASPARVLLLPVGRIPPALGAPLLLVLLFPPLDVGGLEAIMKHRTCACFGEVPNLELPTVRSVLSASNWKRPLLYESR